MPAPAADTPFANELMRSIQPQHRTLLYIAVFLHDIAKGRVEDHSIAGARIARRFCPRLGCSPAETETVAWLVEQHLVMSSVAQSRDLSDRMTIQNFAGVAQSIERMKLLTILTTADIKGVGPGVWNGWKAQLLRTLYYETEPVLTGGFSEVNRAQRVAVAQAEFRAELKDWPPAELDAYVGRHYPAYWLKVDLPQKLAHARFLRAAEAAGKSLVDRHRLRFRARRDRAHGAGARPSLAVVDHRRRLRHGGRQYRGRADLHHHRRAGARHHRGVARVRARRGRGAARRARRRHHRAGAARRPSSCPRWWRSGCISKGRYKAFALEPEVMINNAWSDRYTMVEVTGLDRPGLLFELTTTLSKLNLNIGSAHVATFGERVVDVFYITDLFGAKITSPTRQTAIKRALIQLLVPPDQASGKPARAARQPVSGIQAPGPPVTAP